MCTKILTIPELNRLPSATTHAPSRHPRCFSFPHFQSIKASFLFHYHFFIFQLEAAAMMAGQLQDVMPVFANLLLTVAVFVVQVR